MDRLAGAAGATSRVSASMHALAGSLANCYYPAFNLHLIDSPRRMLSIIGMSHVQPHSKMQYAARVH